VNLGQGRQALMNRGFDYLLTDQLDLMLNAGKDEFEDVWEWPWLQVPFSGPTPLVIAGFKLMLTVKASGTHDELLGLDVRQASQGWTDLTEKGTPEYWWLEGTDRLHAWPGDGATLNGLCIAETPPLLLPDHEPLIPARYHSIWIDYAVVEAYKDSDNFAAAQALRGDIGLRMQDVIARYETRNRQHSPFMTMRAINEDD